jgi:type I restriction-modification system DNA methylase subunit
MHTYYEVKDLLHDELDDIVKKGELSAGSLDTIDKLLNAIKNSCKIIMYEEYSEDGYSNADGSMTNYSNARGRGSNARRDSMGRYSRDGGYAYRNRGRYSRAGYSYADDKDEKMQILHEMREHAQTDDEMRVIDKLIRRMEKE